MPQARDAILRSIQAAYTVGGTTGTWLEAVLEPLDALGIGPWTAYTVDDRRIDDFVGSFPIPIDAIRESMRVLPPALRRAAYAPSPPVDFSRRRWARIAAAMGASIGEVEERIGFRIIDVLGVLGCDSRGRGALLTVLGCTSVAPRTKRTLSDLAAHVAAAYRLRKRLAEPGIEAEAVCSPTGELLAGAPPAVAKREPLALAVRRLDALQGSMRRLDPDEAVESWTALVEGRWSLVDSVERDGKRFVLAYRNEPRASVTALRGAEARVAALAALGHSDKYIAYELGLARSTIATHLRRALAKLRVASRSELVRVYGPLASLT